MSARRQIIAALSEDSHGGIATLHDVERAEQMLNAYRTEVRAEAAADVHRAELPTFPAGETPENVAKVVRAVDVRLAERGAEAPYGVAREDATAEAAPATPDFFEPGRTYQHSAWQFRCDTVTTRPDTSERVALGWFRFSNGEWGVFSATEPEWADGWADVTDQEAPRD